MKYIAIWLSGLCILMFLLQSILSTESFLLINTLKFQEPHRLFTSLFAHSSLGHLLSNLFALALFGLVLEGRIGPKRVLALFLVSGLLINIFSPYPRSLGASGAIYSILGTLVVLRPLMTVWVSGMPMPMFFAGIVWLIQDVFGIFIPSNIANLAHISGLFIGVFMGFVWRKRFSDKIKKGKHSSILSSEELEDWEKQYMK